MCGVFFKVLIWGDQNPKSPGISASCNGFVAMWFPSLFQVITVKGFADLDVPRKLLFRVFREWLAEATPEES